MIEKPAKLTISIHESIVGAERELYELILSKHFIITEKEEPSFVVIGSEFNKELESSMASEGKHIAYISYENDIFLLLLENGLFARFELEYSKEERESIEKYKVVASQEKKEIKKLEKENKPSSFGEMMKTIFDSYAQAMDTAIKKDNEKPKTRSILA